MKKQPVPTLEDVARAAKVSTATVSRCLNSPSSVVEKTRARVMKAVKEMGYSPNFGARALAAKRTNTMGAVIPTMENAIFARGIQAFQEELQEQGVTLLVASSSYSEELEEEQIRALTARGADGLLLIGYDRSKEIYDFLESRNLPVLIVWVYDPNENRMSIGFNNREAMAELAEAVIAAGHRRIGFISAIMQGNDRARERVTGVREAMKRNGLNSDELALVETKYSIDCGAEFMRQLMERDKRPTAVMCGNDVLAVGALRMARKMGLRVPEDVSITGFDDIELATVVDPPLTTVHVPHRKMGREAARILVRMLQGDPPPHSIRLATSLRLRETLGPPPE